MTLTKQELLRLRTAQRVLDRGMTVAEAAQALNLSTRQIKRLTRRLRLHGEVAFASPRRGERPNNAFAPELRQRVIALARSTYAGFAPTLLSEKLAQRDGLHVNRETLRAWLIAEGFHRARRRRLHPRPPRERRARLGELVQVDGSPHHWFEERGEPCTLLLAIDDATSCILGGLFADHETTEAYFELFERAFAEHGLPVAIYSDKHAIFRINSGTPTEAETQVQRALRELNVELICANSPQAKGRVERANRTLQDRFVKEFRLAGISTTIQANQALPALLAQHNARFAVAPRDTQNAHRSPSNIPLATILTKRYERVLTANLTFQINERIYALERSSIPGICKGMRISVEATRSQQIFVVHRGRRIEPRFVGARQRAGQITDSKRLNDEVDRRRHQPKTIHLPAADHPWRAYVRRAPASARGHL